MSFPSVALALVCFASLFAACSSVTPAQSSSSATSSSSTSSTGAGGNSGQGGNGGEGGRYHDGIYTCCAKGEGLACCPPDSLPDAGSGKEATCFKYGGVLGDCVPAGGQLEGKDICALCCGSLERIDNSAPDAQGNCQPTNPPSVLICAACGDGMCGVGENRCNCPADCH
jgi:hypothetical protein